MKIHISFYFQTGIIQKDFSRGKGTKPGMILQKIWDSMPGMGNVEAVLGIVIAIQAINGPAEEISHKVSAALVRTFLGVLPSYGFIQPLATSMDLMHEETENYSNWELSVDRANGARKTPWISPTGGWES